MVILEMDRDPDALVAAAAELEAQSDVGDHCASCRTGGGRGHRMHGVGIRRGA
jgi:hypothetical protein